MTEEPKEPRSSTGRTDDSSRPEPDSAARKRVESLVSKKPEGDRSDRTAKGPARPVLTEKQRIEARRARQSRQARRRRKPVEGNPLARGMRVVGFEIRRTASFIGSGIIAALAALGPVFSSVGMGLVWLIEKIGEGLKFARKLVARGLVVAGRLLVDLDRVVTPHRALILVGGVAAIMLGISQYKGLGSIEIGQAGYSGIEDLARAPAIDETTPADVHTRILVPIAAVAFLAVIVIALGTVRNLARRLSRFRRFAAMALVAIGVLTLAVTLLVDLPDATDTSEASLAYAGAQARLLSGFWLELVAGAALAVTGLALLLEPAPGKARSRQREIRTGEDTRSVTGQGAMRGGPA